MPARVHSEGSGTSASAEGIPGPPDELPTTYLPEILLAPVHVRTLRGSWAPAVGFSKQSVDAKRRSPDDCLAALAKESNGLVDQR